MHDDDRTCGDAGVARPFSCPQQEAFIGLGRTWALLDHAFSEALKPYGITPTQYNVLRILRGAGPSGLCRSEVMERMIAQVPDGTRLLDRIESAGLIARERSDEDRRYVTTRITDAGTELLAELDGLVEALHTKHFRTLEEEELTALIDLLVEVRRGLSE